MEAPEKIYLHPDEDGEVFGKPWSSIPFNKHNVEYTRTDAFIEKASKWFKIRYEWIDIDGTRNYDKSAFEDFKNYIKDESNIYLSKYD